jgi:hypothetical protein
MELDPVHELDLEPGAPASGRLAASLRGGRTQVATRFFRSSPRRLVGLLRRSGSASTGPFNSGSRARASGHPVPPHALPVVALIAIALTLAVATYGVETDRKSVAMVGLAATALVAVAMGVSARKSIRTGERFCEVLDRDLAKSERARDELHFANERLHRRNADLRALQLAVVQGFDFINERTQGRLKELVEEAGDEFAALVDEALEGPTESAQ